MLTAFLCPPLWSHRLYSSQHSLQGVGGWGCFEGELAEILPPSPTPSLSSVSSLFSKPASLPLTKTLGHYPFEAKWLSKTCFFSLASSLKKVAHEEETSVCLGTEKCSLFSWRERDDYCLFPLILTGLSSSHVKSALMHMNKSSLSNIKSTPWII